MYKHLSKGIQQQSNLCDKYLLVDNVQYQYCLRHKNLNNIVINQQIFSAQQSNHMFIYAQSTKSSDIQLQMQQVSQFSVFGFNTQKQDIIDSDIFVTISYSILTGALICMQCNIDIQTSQLQFVAHGIQISALILKSIDTVQISKVNISFRFQSNFSSGIINQVNQSIAKFTISQSVLTGFNNFSSISNGYICSKLYVDITVEINSLSVCIENTSRFGFSSFIGSVTQSEIETCAICKADNFVTYGLCQQQPQFSVLLLNSTVVCEHPFVFNDQMNVCECSYGFFLNNSFCVNVVQQLSITLKNNTIFENSMINEIQRTEMELKTTFVGLEQLIMSNISDLVQIVNDNDFLINNNIRSTNQTVHQNIIELRTENANEFSTMTANIENKHILATTNLVSVNTTLKNVLDVQTALIVENQVNIKNGFIVLKDQVSDFRTNISSVLEQVDQHVSIFYNDLKADLAMVDTSLKDQLYDQTSLLVQNQYTINGNFIVQKDQMANLQTAVDIRFSTIDSLIQSANHKLDDMTTQISSTKLDIQTQLTGAQTQIQEVSTYMTNTVATQAYLKTVYDSLMGTVSTRTQLNSTYNSLLTAVNALAVPNPCKAWPGTANLNGICRCEYQSKNSTSFGYCPRQNQCCAFRQYVNADYEIIELKCANGYIQSSQFFAYASYLYTWMASACGEWSTYTNM
ncbi:Hypothetical_protein [Hexamita inflata]|uniref:Hypothetical_protein n=1 Tax=Hexamita inflata TaxID=28002 RepID=A0AA86NBP9_9EUKA|nr:Hypothetical protein HINF_LOCUS3995 [Hexamita inflata]